VNHRCIDELQLDRLLELAEDHPDRRSVNSCTRCRALLTQYAAFKTAHVPNEARYEAAESALERFKESLVRDPAHTKPPAPSSPWSFWSWFRGPRARFAWGAVAAAVVLVVAAVTWAPWDEREIVLRSESPAPEQRIELPELRFDDAGAVHLYWPRVRAADAYRVIVHTTRFEQVFSETTADTVLVLTFDDLTGDVGTDDILQWRIEALHGGEVISRSRPGVIRHR
jgi:hypothetical protein